MRLRGTHQSLRYDVPVGATVDYLARLVDHQSADVLTCTEAGRQAVTRRLRRRLKRERGRSWRVHKAGEFLIAWDSDLLPQDKRGFSLGALSRITWGGPKGGTRKFRAACKRLRTRDGRKFFVRPFHAPASVQAGSRWKRRRGRLTLRARASRAGFADLGNKINAAHRAFPDAVTVTPGDYNLDQLLAVWRHEIADHLGTSIWGNGRLPDHGTHGRRLIDGANVRGGVRVIASWVAHKVPRPRGMDHDPISYILEL